MALAIRLTRGGAKKRPVYRIVVADSRAARDGRFIEKLGTYNPLFAKDSPDRVTLDSERAAYWLSVGAQPSDRVARFLDAAGLMKRTASVNAKKGEPGEKAKERAEVKANKAAEAAEAEAEAKAAVAAALAAPAVVEAVAEEAVAEEAPAVEAVVEEAPAAEVVEDAAAVEVVAEAPVEAETAAEPVAEEAAAETPAEPDAV